MSLCGRCCDLTSAKKGEVIMAIESGLCDLQEGIAGSQGKTEDGRQHDAVGHGLTAPSLAVSLLCHLGGSLHNHQSCKMNKTSTCQNC